MSRTYRIKPSNKAIKVRKTWDFSPVSRKVESRKRYKRHSKFGNKLAD